jgi:gamma-glutamylcysteine synthetase
MTLRERVNLLIKPAVLKKKFKDLEEADWLAAVQVIKLLSDNLAVTENTASIKDNPAKLMFEILSKKNAEVMTALNESDITLDDQGREVLDTLTKFMDKGVTYVQNLNSMKAMAKDQEVKPKDAVIEDDEDNDFYSPEKYAAKK